MQQDVEKQMGSSLTVMRGNFRLFVVKVKDEDEKLIWLGQHFGELPGSGILYTGIGVNIEIYSRWMEFLNVSSVHYNVGLDIDGKPHAASFVRVLKVYFVLILNYCVVDNLNNAKFV